MISTELGKNDYTALNNYVYKEALSTMKDKRSYRLWQIATWIIVLVATIFYTHFVNKYVDYKFNILLILTILSISIAIALIIFETKIQKIILNDITFPMKMNYEIIEEGLKIETSCSSIILKWAGIKRIRKYKDYHYVFVSYSNAYIIPKNDTFVNTLYDKLKEFRSETNH